ncbi:MAG: response regulator [Desulfobacterales bacterium]|jgi:DNA-binding response OmpR family regulator
MEKKSVLIVDDEMSILVPLQFLMEKSGFRVTLAQSGKDALTSIAESRPDVILLDIMLPDLDGYEIFQMIRENRRWDDIKIIFLTAKTSDRDIARGLNLGVDAYITKPFANQELLATVHSVLVDETTAMEDGSP